MNLEGAIDSPVEEVETLDLDSPESGDEFGAEMWPTDTSEDETEEGEASTSRAPEPASEFDPTQLNLARVDPQSVPEQYRELVTVAQEQFKGLQTTLNERNSTIETTNEELNRLRAAQQPQQPTTPQFPSQNGVVPTPENPYGPVFGDISQLEPEVQHEMLTGARQVDALITNYFGAESLQYIQALPQIMNAVVQLVEGRESDQTAAATNAMDEAAAIYGENVGKWKHIIEPMIDQENPATGRPFTTDEAVRHVLGITAEQAQELREKAAQVRTGARKRVRPAPRAPAQGRATPGQTSLQDGIAKMQDAGFE